MVINVCIPTIFSAKVETHDKGNIEEEQIGEDIHTAREGALGQI